MYCAAPIIGNSADTKWFARVQAELERRGFITITPLGTKWHFEKMRHNDLMGLEDDLRDRSEGLDLFRHNLGQFLGDRD